MICFKCDRCGETFTVNNAPHKIRKLKTVHSVVIGDRDFCEGEFNLCPNCMKELNDWMSLDAYTVTRDEKERLLKEELMQLASEIFSSQEEDSSVYKKVGESEDGDVYAKV